MTEFEKEIAEVDKKGRRLIFYIVLSMAATVFAIVQGSKIECENVGRRMGLETSWGLLQPCMVKTPRGWRLLDQHRQMEVEEK